ncbi:MAG: hypothetical protein M1833_003371 [Piccolia ochrophora]|nr:MAG: hypothetical protein M1833_003371 [Piccolia ochrophora]
MQSPRHIPLLFEDPYLARHMPLLPGAAKRPDSPHPHDQDLNVSVPDFNFSTPSRSRNGRHTASSSRTSVYIPDFGGRFVLEPSARSQFSSPTSFASKTPSDATEIFPIGPQWPRNVRLVLRVSVILWSAAILGLMAHTLSAYLQTRELSISTQAGIVRIWPRTAKVFPLYFLLGVSAVAVVVSIASLVYSFRRYEPMTLSLADKVGIATSIVVLIAWIASLVLFRQSGVSDKMSLGRWACYYRKAEVKSRIDFGLVCDEQTAAQYIGLAIVIAEVVFLLTFAIATYLTRNMPINVPVIRNSAGRWTCASQDSWPV